MTMIRSLVLIATLCSSLFSVAVGGGVPDGEMTLVIDFAGNTEDVSVEFKTEVVINKTPEMLLNFPFDAFPERTWQNKRFVKRIGVVRGQLYRLEIRQRENTEGVRGYALYKGSSIDEANLMFTDSHVSTFEGNYAILEKPQQDRTPPPTKRPTRNQTKRPTRRPTKAPRRTLRPTRAKKKTKVTLSIRFAAEPEDVSVIVKSRVPLNEESHIVLDQPFDSFRESRYKNKRFRKTFDVFEDTLYAIELRQRFGANGVKEYSLFKGAGTHHNNRLFRDSSLQDFNGNTFLLEG